MASAPSGEDGVAPACGTAAPPAAAFDAGRYALHRQGAEAVSEGCRNCRARSAAPTARPCNAQRIWEGTLFGRPIIVKQRFSKQYRHPLLDAKLTASRLKQEVRSMARARKLGVRTPGGHDDV